MKWLIAGPLALALSAFACAAAAGDPARPSVDAGEAIIVDGLAEEKAWLRATRFSDFGRVQPLSLAAHDYRTTASVGATDQGIIVHFDSRYPPGVAQTGAPRVRDSKSLESDYVQVVVDFDGTGHRAYEFTVTISGTQRDGIFSNENMADYDWDGTWSSAVRKLDDGWSAELLIPWTIAPMGKADGSRNVGVRFSRAIESRGEIIAYPAISPEQPRFISSFAPVGIADYSPRSVDVFWHASTNLDLVRDASKFRTGLDVFWKLDKSLRLAATVNPDFGQVEADDLVVNFDAIEPYFSEKRPFFTENQALYNIRTPRNDRLVYTRRMGGSLADGSGTAQIDAAAKVSGNLAGFDFGAFAVLEESDSGRDFYALRLLRATKKRAAGYLATYAADARTNASSVVQTLDGSLQLGSAHAFSGIGIFSKNRNDGRSTDGFGGVIGWKYSPGARFNTELTYTHYDRDLDFNRIGYLKRNSLRQIYSTTTFRSTAAARADGQRATTRSVVASHQQNADGLRLEPFVYLKQTVVWPSGNRLHTELRWLGPGADDLMTRGNGSVDRPSRSETWIYYATPFNGRWKYSLGVWAFQEGIGRSHAIQFEPEVSLQAAENFELSFTVLPRWSNDWLTWQGGNRLARFRRTQADVSLRMSYIPNNRHEFRLKAQWVAINAKDGTGYRIDDHGEPAQDHRSVSDFQVRTFSAQLRYRYIIDNQRELYLVYGRGGYHRNDASSLHGTAGLLWQSGGLRDDEQVLLKIRWLL